MTTRELINTPPFIKEANKLGDLLNMGTKNPLVQSYAGHAGAGAGIGAIIGALINIARQKSVLTGALVGGGVGAGIGAGHRGLKHIKGYDQWNPIDPLVLDPLANLRDKITGADPDPFK